MGPLGFIFLACGALLIYSGFTGQELVPVVKDIFSGGGGDAAVPYGGGGGGGSF